MIEHLLHLSTLALTTSLVIAQSECPEAMLYCVNGGDIASGDCTTRPWGPYERQRTTLCNCSDGYAGPGCEFVTTESRCAATNRTLIRLPTPTSPLASLGCQIDDDMSSELLNLIDHAAYVDLDLASGAMTLEIESRLQNDDGTYSDVADIIFCAMSQCAADFDSDGVLTSTFCNVSPGDCVGMFPDDLFLVSLNGVAASFVQVADNEHTLINVALQSIYVLPLNMQCLSGYCGYNRTDPNDGDSYS